MYILAEWEYETRWDNYLFDCTWSQAVGSNFVEYTGAKPQHNEEYPTKPTLPRWRELFEPKKEELENIDDKTRMLFEITDMR